MANPAPHRLKLEYNKLTSEPLEDISVGLVTEENFLEWEAKITGPKGTCFEGGIFPVRFVFPPDYPYSPPNIKFTCELFHPNIFADGRVCVFTMKEIGEDQMGYEPAAELWAPVMTVEKILVSVAALLTEPNEEAIANMEAATMWKENRDEFNKIARRSVAKSLGIPTTDST